MPIEIIVPQFKSEWHQHSCMYCRKVRYEPNDICKKTKIDSHRFPCVTCLQSYRRRFGSMADEMLDIYLNSQQREMVKHVAPDKVSDYLDQRDAHRAMERSQQEQTIAASDSARTISGLDGKSDSRDAAEQTKELERTLQETTETITWEEAQSEIEAMKKKEGER